MKDEKYRLGTCRGNGGYGMVYTGYNVNYEDSVAIKYVVKDKNCDFYSNLRELSFLCSSFCSREKNEESNDGFEIFDETNNFSDGLNKNCIGVDKSIIVNDFL